MALAIDLWRLEKTAMRNFWMLLCLAATYGVALSQPHDATEELPLIIYKIQAGDTLTQLSRKYLKQPADLEAIRSLNSLRSIDLLPTGELLKIPRQAVKQSPSQATIIALSCSRPIRAGTPLRPMSIGSILNEGSIIDIPAECHVSMLLEDGSIIRMPSSAAIKIAVLRRNALEASPEVQLDLVRGKIELEVYKGRSQTTPFEVRTPLSVTGVRGTEFRVGYAPSEQTGQVEVLGGTVSAMGLKDAEAQPVKRGQGMPFDSSGKSLPIEKLLNPPVFERAERTNSAPSSYLIKLTSRPESHHYVAVTSKSANLLGEQTSRTIKTPEVTTPSLSQDVLFYQFATVSKAGLMGPARQYGFCVTLNEAKSGRCKATFDAPMTENLMITFSLTKHTQGTTQELVSTKKLQSRNGQFTIEGLPSGYYTWEMSHSTTTPGSAPSVTRQSGSFDLFTLTASP